MESSLRTYRMLAPWVSVLVLLSMILPLIQQVCCDEPMSLPAEPACHETMADAMQDMHSQDMPYAGLQKHMRHGNVGLHDDCCVFTSAQMPISQSLLLTEATSRVLHPILLAFASLVQPARTAQPPAMLADASPPAPPLSLHLLHGSLLN